MRDRISLFDDESTSANVPATKPMTAPTNRFKLRYAVKISRSWKDAKTGVSVTFRSTHSMKLRISVAARPSKTAFFKLAIIWPDLVSPRKVSYQKRRQHKLQERAYV